MGGVKMKIDAKLMSNVFRESGISYKPDEEFVESLKKEKLLIPAEEYYNQISKNIPSLHDTKEKLKELS
jgi:hypothetical protein